MFFSPIRRSISVSKQCCSKIRRQNTVIAGRALSNVHASSSKLTLGSNDRATLAKFSIQRSSFSTASIIRQEEQKAEAAAEEEVKEMDDGEKNIHDILTRTFLPEHLEVRDVSGGCGSFYAIVVASEQFNGKPTVKAHRLVNEALKDVIAGIHGLQLRTMPIKK